MTSDHKRWVWRFASIAVAIILALVVIFRNVLGLDQLMEEGQIAIATMLGLAGIVAVSVGLMATVFYSSRAGHDERVLGDREESGASKTSDSRFEP